MMSDRENDQLKGTLAKQIVNVANHYGINMSNILKCEVND